MIVRWSRKHDACIGCGTDTIPHKARGLCRNCYQRRYFKKYRRTLYTQAEMESGVDDALVWAAGVFNDILREHGVRCRYRDRKLEIGGKVHEFTP